MKESPFKVEPPKIVTVKTLREYFDKMESLWTAKDTKYMGEFENHKINIVYCKSGIGPSKIIYHGGLDFVMMEKEEF